MTDHTLRIPPKLIPVFEGQADVRGSWGGRGSGKTRTFAMMCAAIGMRYGQAGIGGQILCGRQYMNSLEDSSLEEIKRAIFDDEILASYYDVGDKYIKSRDGRISFTFAGLDRSIASIKSKGRILLCWIDEAEDVSETAYQILEPTLREEGDGWNAELWVTWNPKRKGSATDRRFRNTSDQRIKIAKVNWQDNPRFPRILERKRQACLQNDPENYDWIWEGAYATASGAILGKWVAEAERDGRITNVDYDPRGAPIIVSSDIGFRDTAGWWYWQPVKGGARVLKYDGDSGLDAEEWIPRVESCIDELGAELGAIHLPHDAWAKTFRSRYSSADIFRAYFGTNRVKKVPSAGKPEQIQASRSFIRHCEFDEEQCETGLDGLRSWEFRYSDDLGTFSKDPLHNWASHPSDAFAYGCLVLRDPEEKQKKLTEDQHALANSVQNVSMGKIFGEHLKRQRRLHERI